MYRCTRNVLLLSRKRLWGCAASLRAFSQHREFPVASKGFRHFSSSKPDNGEIVHKNVKSFEPPVHCIGCGASFQFKYPNLAGYVDVERYKAYVDANTPTSSEDNKWKIDEHDENAEAVVTQADVEGLEDPVFQADDVGTAMLEQLNRPNMSEGKRAEILKQLNNLTLSENFWSKIPTQASFRRKKRSAWAKKNIRCVRCYQLTNYGATQGNVLAVSDDNFRLLLKQRFQHADSKRYVIIKVVDLFDFDGSFIDDFQRIVGKRHTVLLAVNKLDMFPEPFSPQLSRLRAWIKQRAVAHGLNVHSVHPISAVSGDGIRALVTKAAELAEELEGEGYREIYLVGNTNVGKSAIVNMMMEKHLIRRSGTYREMADDGSIRKEMTQSMLPGTTLGIVAFPLIPYRRGTLYDTPGVVNYRQIGIRLTREELKAIVPARDVTPHTYRVRPGQSLLLGGFAQIDVLSEKDFFLTCFVSRKLIIHVTKTANVENFLEKQSGVLLTPPFSVERCREVGVLSAHDNPEGGVGTTFRLPGKGWLEASHDIVIPGIGWVAVTGAGVCDLRVVCPAGIHPFPRPPLMPFEARTTTFKTYGNPLRIRPSLRAQRRRLLRKNKTKLLSKLPQKKELVPPTHRAERRADRKRKASSMQELIYK